MRRSPLRLDVDTVREFVAAGALLIDVRRHEDATATLERAVRISPDEIPARIADFPRNVPILLACT